jgi:hypothetical protein
VAAAYLAPATDRDVLIRFYERVRPFGPGWSRIRRLAAPAGDAARGENIPMALLGWVAGCTAIWSALFAVGNFLYGRRTAAVLLTLVFAVSAAVVIEIVRRLWTGAGAGADRR